MADSLQAGTETTLRIAVDIIFPSELLYNVLAKVSSEFPQLRIEIEETVLSGANSLLSSGKADSEGISRRDVLDHQSTHNTVTVF